MADIAERTNDVGEVVLEDNIHAARALIPISVAGQSRECGERAAKTGCGGPDDGERTAEAIPSHDTVTQFRNNRGMIPPRISSTRNAPVGILVSGIRCSNQMLHVVLEKPGL